MNEQLQSTLRTALRERASVVPDVSVQRLTGQDYRPRRTRLRPPIAIGASATAAAAAGGVALILSLSAGASNAFAGWTPTPTHPAPGQVQAAQTSCQSGQSPVAGLPLKLADTRGPFTFSVYADSQTSAACIKGPSFTAVTTNSSSVPVSVPAGQIQLSSAHPPPHANQAYSFAEGRTGAGVTSVALVLDDGTNVQATVGNGWYVAWWPGDENIKSAQVTTPAGVKTETLNPGPQLPPVNGSGSGSSSGSVSAGGSAGSSVSGGSGGESEQSFGVSP
ncbi:MAG TPA: hypothetical protein VMF57_04860 [Solirubrobacteraceae bacterium]|nr:hypothetical protein [Solirubrobacteraceae bacterium]